MKVSFSWNINENSWWKECLKTIFHGKASTYSLFMKKKSIKGQTCLHHAYCLAVEKKTSFASFTWPLGVGNYVSFSYVSLMVFDILNYIYKYNIVFIYIGFPFIMCFIKVPNYLPMYSFIFFICQKST